MAVKRPEYDNDARRVTVHTKEGQPIIFDLNMLSPEVIDGAALVGLATKFSKAKDQPKLIQQLGEGTWPERTKKSTAARIPLAVEAVARLMQKDVEECSHLWAHVWSDEQKKELEGDTRIKALIIEVRKERAAADAAGNDNGDSTLPAPPPDPVASLFPEAPPTA